MKLVPSLLMLFCLISGCAGVQSQQEPLNFDSWLGENISGVVMNAGPPNKKAELPDGNTVWTWDFSTERPTVYSQLKTTGQVIAHGGGTDTCIVNFMTNKEGTILKWSSLC